MPFRVTFDLDDKDIKYFRDQMKQARQAVSKLSEDQVLDSAAQMVEEIKGTKVPMFVAVRVAKLTALIDMVRDEDWKLPAKERKNVVAALTYFADPQDIIPDAIPVLGFIDDAIMIELITSELRPEIDAYNDFCRYRREADRRSRGRKLSREQYLEGKRKELQGRMRRRRVAGSQAKVPAARTRIRLF